MNTRERTMRWPRERRGPGGPRATPWITGALTAALTASAACTADSGSGDDTGLPGGEKPARAFALKKEPQWTSGKIGMKKVFRTEIRGNTTVIWGADKYLRNKLAVVDTDSGKVRWSAKRGDLLSKDAILIGESREFDHEKQNLLIVGSGKDLSVLAPYGIPSSENDINGKGGPHENLRPPNPKKTGVAALSGQDGSLRWKTEVDGKPLMLDTDGKTVLAAGDRDYGNGPRASYGIDATSGRKLWSRSKQWVPSLAGDTAIGGSRYAAQGIWHNETNPYDNDDALFGLDARSGRQKWSLSGEYYGSLLLGAVEGSAVATVNGERGITEFETDSRQVVLDTETGSEKDEFYAADPDSETELSWALSHCGTDQTRSFGRGTLLACSNRPGQLLTIRAGEHDQPVISGPSLEEDTDLQPEVAAVARGRIYLNDGLADRSSEPSLAVNRTSDTLHRRLPGQIMAVGPRHIAVRTDMDRTADEPDTGVPLAIYRTTKGTSPPATPSDRSS